MKEEKVAGIYNNNNIEGKCICESPIENGTRN
jgi:hypothetical protein